MPSEAVLLARIRLAASAAGARLFRNNVGVLRDARGRHVRYGLCPGSADLIGWVPYRILPEHVGQTVARFTAVEVKAATGRATPAQTAFLAAVRRAGGVAFVARSEEDAVSLLGGVG